ncbi:MAG: DNA-binding response regulator [Gammaproteobacteria bacterium]|jgi:two-component system response regulator PhoP|nr:DNA-binding response regulator [Gammaproteobacteria bacterium]|tara:strand:- start:1637 stop:2320 length:684 start_codon:yes stop_codon:yes gene_type:complete
MTQHLLLVEDEPKLREQLVELLEKNLFTVDACEDGQRGLHMGQKYHYDIAVIDLGLPKISGIEVIERLRAEGKDCPILILTARGDWKDKVDGLSVGADDYLVKPFHVQEFLARLEALIRRASGKLKTVIEHGPLRLDTKGKQVAVDGIKVDLTAYEFNLLQYLLMRPGEVISKSELTDHLYDQDFDRDSNVIEVFVGRLRKKIDPDNLLKPIETVRGQGYRFKPVDA